MWPVVIPAPADPLPWSQDGDTAVIRDADGKPVSMVKNAAFLMGLVRAHQAPLTIELQRAEIKTLRTENTRLEQALKFANDNAATLAAKIEKLTPPAAAAAAPSDQPKPETAA